MKRKIVIFILCFFIFDIVLIAQDNIKSDSISHEIFGSILSKNGSKIKVKLDQVYSRIPKVNTSGELMKSFEKEVLGAKVSGWLVLGNVKFISKENLVTTFTLIEEKSIITIDGVKENHFIPWQKVKFCWKEPLSADEVFYEKGMKAMANDKPAAMGFFKQATAANPQHAEAWNMTGMIHNENKDYDSALYSYKIAYGFDTTNLKYIKNISITYTYINKFPEAYSYAVKAVMYGPADAEAHYLRAMTNLYYLIYYLDGKISGTDKKQIMSDLDFAVSVDEKVSFYYKERMVVRNFFEDFTGACADAKKYQLLEGSTGDEFVKEYCK